MPKWRRDSTSAAESAGLSAISGRRSVLLQLPGSAVPARRHWPICDGLEVIAIQLEAEKYFGVTLKETKSADVFTALAVDLIRRMDDSSTPDTQAATFVGQLSRWQRFLSSSTDGLGETALRGLWGELFFLSEHVLPSMGTSAVRAWTGPLRAHQDFQVMDCAVEVKTTVTMKPLIVRVTSERQLDDGGWRSLYLYALALDDQGSDGLSLPQLVDRLRHTLAPEPADLEVFEDGLVAYGYFESHATRYATKTYLVRSEHAFAVVRDFPRITERGLPNGVGSVSYDLALAACESYAVDVGYVMSDLRDH